MTNRITSRQNSLIRHVKKLGEDKKYRQEHGQFVSDGLRCLCEAAASGTVTAVFAVTQSDETSALPLTLVTEDILGYISPLKNPQDVVFVCKMPGGGEKPSPSGKYIILDGVQDPGNVGTIIRTAAALGVDGAILAGDCADLYNPKTIRATMGAVFKIPVYQLSYAQIRELTLGGLKICSAALSENARDISECDIRGMSAAIGSEGKGLSAELLEMCALTVTIPMKNNVESLNAGSAAAILMWESLK